MEKIGAHTALSETIAQWAAIERLKGYSDREIYKRFYLTTGLDVLNALNGSRSRKEFEETEKLVRSWYE